MVLEERDCEIRESRRVCRSSCTREGKAAEDTISSNAVWPCLKHVFGEGSDPTVDNPPFDSQPCSRCSSILADSIPKPQRLFNCCLKVVLRTELAEKVRQLQEAQAVDIDTKRCLDRDCLQVSVRKSGLPCSVFVVDIVSFRELSTHILLPCEPAGYGSFAGQAGSDKVAGADDALDFRCSPHG